MTTQWVRTSEVFANTQSLHSVIRPSCYSHSCTLAGQLFVQQHSKWDQCPDPAGEAVFSFVSGCCVFILVCFLHLGSGFLMLCFVVLLFFFNQLHVCISTWHDADKRTSTGVEDHHPNGPPGNRVWNPQMPKLCFSFAAGFTLLRFAVLWCLCGYQVSWCSFWPDRFSEPTPSWLSHQGSTMHCWG